MIRNAQAIRYDGTVSSQFGRNEPLRVVAETDDGEEIEVFLKISARPELGVEGLANELIAAFIAGQLNLPICEPFLVHLSTDWIESISDTATRNAVRQSVPLGFGSRSAGDGWKTWAAADHILGDRRPVALSIFAFDAFTENADRRPIRPNILIRGNEFRIIDHETCFRIRLILVPPARPWEIGNLSRLTMPDSHIFGHLLKGDRRVDVASLRPAWLGLSNDFLADCEACVPAQWQEAAGAVQDAVNHLRAIRDRIDECLTELQRALQ